MFALFRRSVELARHYPDLYFVGLLTHDDISSAFGVATARGRSWIYSPLVTITVFLTQCLSSDHSCREAVSKLIAWRVRNKIKSCSPKTGAYCISRDQLTEKQCQDLARQTGKQLEDSAPKGWLWHGRRVCVIDGSTITMPDTEANQAEYPQQKQQKPGCGFPIARILVVFSLSVGSAVELLIGPYKGKKTGETSMLRTIHDQFSKGDVALVDRLFAGWFDIALRQQQGIDTVARKNHNRLADFQTGKKLGKDDHIVTIPRPDRPRWMTKKVYNSLPDKLTIRQVRVRVTQRGFRTKEVIVDTTLLDDIEITKDDLTNLYRQRWMAELNLRSIKNILQMDHLRCKTPERVRKEFYMHMLAYNLIRKVMAIAAKEAGVSPYQISFKGALQTLSNFLLSFNSQTDIEQWCRALINAIGAHQVADRPDRYEPRVRKRRPKPYPLMTKPRNDYKNSIK